MLTSRVTTYTYDANGNLTNAAADAYTWDWANRMTGATVGGINASYSYDAFDIRVSNTVSRTASNYLWDRLAPIRPWSMMAMWLYPRHRPPGTD
ncbi:MAG: hypothetical protein R2867_17370 [Caldilineaceae bacterium]